MAVILIPVSCNLSCFNYKVLFSFGYEKSHVSLIELPLYMTYKTYWNFCLNDKIVALNTIIYELGFYIYQTLLNDYI